jgi:hypothetical protein
VRACWGLFGALASTLQAPTSFAKPPRGPRRMLDTLLFQSGEQSVIIFGRERVRSAEEAFDLGPRDHERVRELDDFENQTLSSFISS